MIKWTNVDHIDRAEDYFAKYIELATQIDEIETSALRQAPNRALAKIELERYVDWSGRTYAQLCSIRDTYMNVAQLSATMAIMLRQI